MIKDAITSFSSAPGGYLVLNTIYICNNYIHEQIGLVDMLLILRTFAVNISELWYFGLKNK